MIVEVSTIALYEIILYIHIHAPHMHMYTNPAYSFVIFVSQAWFLLMLSIILVKSETFTLKGRSIRPSKTELGFKELF